MQAGYKTSVLALAGEGGVSKMQGMRLRVKCVIRKVDRDRGGEGRKEGDGFVETLASVL